MYSNCHHLWLLSGIPCSVLQSLRKWLEAAWFLDPLLGHHESPSSGAQWNPLVQKCHEILAEIETRIPMNSWVKLSGLLLNTVYIYICVAFNSGSISFKCAWHCIQSHSMRFPTSISINKKSDLGDSNNPCWKVNLNHQQSPLKKGNLNHLFLEG